MNTPEQNRAHTKLNRAVKSGAVKRHEKDCQLCGRCCKHIRLSGHHYKGYDFPLEVWWICQRCNHLLKHRHDDSLSIGQARAIVTAYYLKGFCQKCHNEKAATHRVLTRHLG